jgi:hypothetical protein
MTTLSGEFETDLPRPDALTACAEAIDGLGWHVESVEADRVVSYPGADGGRPSARIEVLLSAPGRTTDVRIVGTDDPEAPVEREELIADLNRARDAIRASIESADESALRSSRFEGVPLFRERPPAVQIVTAVIVPAIFGAVAGIVLGISAAGYWAIQALALIGAVVAGLEHTSGQEGALRGLVGGTLYGAFLLIAHGVAGTDATVKLPKPALVLVVFTALFGVLGSGLGGRLRRSAIER